MCLKLRCLNLHMGNGTQYVWRGVNPMPRPPPSPTFTFNDCITHKHQQHALNAFVLDLVKSRGSSNNNNNNNNKNNNNNNIHSMTSLTLHSMTSTLHLMTLTLHLITTCLIRSSRHLISIIMTSLTPH